MVILHRLLSAPALLGAFAVLAAERSDVMIASFEDSDLEGWTRSGDAFQQTRPQPGANFTGRHGATVAWSGRAGFSATGIIESPPVKLERPFLSFRVLGERNLPSEVGVELLVDGAVVRAASATEHRSYLFEDATTTSQILQWRTWDVSAFAGKTVRVRVNDRSNVGAIAVDEFVQSDSPRSAPIDASQRLNETYRPQFHFTPVQGWMNDPNGLVHYRGIWHLFYQYKDPSEDVITWGHATSADLFSWQHRPVAIPADSADSSYSGSGLVDFSNASGLKQGTHDPILLFYSRRPPGPKLVKLPAPPDARRMTQEMAYSTDGGATWQRFHGNPILATPTTATAIRRCSTSQSSAFGTWSSRCRPTMPTAPTHTTASSPRVI